MSTIRILSEQILRILNGGNVPRDSQFHELDVQYLVRDTAAKLAKGEWFSERNEGGRSIDSRYVVPFTGLEVKVDDNTQENYIDIPVTSWIRLPYGAGIRSVRPDNTGTTRTKRTKVVETRAFIPIPNRFQDIFFNLPAESLEGMYGWMVRGLKIYFTKRYGKTLKEYEINTITIDIVTMDPKAISVDQDLPLSGELLQQLKTEVIEIMSQGKPTIVDTIDDQNPNIISKS